MLTIIVIGAVIGLLTGGPLGMLIGGGIGWWLGGRLRGGVMLGKGLAEMQRQFMDSTFAVMGAVCQADGQVSGEERQVLEQLLVRLRLPESTKASARAAFERGRASDFDLDAEIARVARLTRGRGALRQIFLQVQLSAIAADGVLHPAEHNMLMRVARGLGCSEAEIAQIEAMLRGGASHGAGATQESQSPLEDAYKVLGISPEASDAEIKRAYRKLMSENHPDKLASRGLPDSMREVAEARTVEIGNAYQRIRQARGQA
ncbi:MULTISPECIES: co-chaperone DjlA [Halomonas]|uniref:co-chaperone DjlA n=1 Tax=Halomonas TaxID=2745 RepID=UPI001A8CD979|nr:MULTISPECIES: co-chaperone DjlA [Halomonas]MED5294634.1 co-chaperone DjlA [Pseudomonadota bacterium]MBN8412882.1 co-chaperone DjlA [Halomonas litopenaei]MBY5929012.1 co-chaperone DjlA [Halomonas sp. DP8Y7-3]MBY5968105.1 co-chaperone DjlA [Halomonas denitrificans]MBY5983598.1 co-chaperone DjlA [Halomonas sp. DP5Y7-2]